ncbi:MAG: DUF411 domain-containing protein [Porticoccaceae bacterium]
MDFALAKRIRFFIVFSVFLTGFTLPTFATEVTVYKRPTCDCCNKWVEHMRINGFVVEALNVADIVPHKKANRVPSALGACHTATVGGYVIEGHVPASDVRRLLKEPPKVLGLAVPGMPPGSPGMEQGSQTERYEVLSFDNAGNTAVYARH